MEHTNLRLPIKLWERCKKHAATLNKSATATAVDCVADCLDEMEKRAPEVPKIVRLFHFLAKK